MGHLRPRELAELSLIYGAMQKPVEFEKLLELVYYRPHQTILEIGSGRGGTLWAWCHLPHNLTTISIDLPGGEFGGGLTEEDRARIENWQNPAQNTYLAALDSHDPKTLAEIKDTLANGEVDILFVDGDHTYEGVKKDFEMYSPLVKDGGIIAFHDICKHPPETNCTVDRFWHEIKDRYIFKEFISEPTFWGGIGVIEWVGKVGALERLENGTHPQEG